jgi:acyl-CoA thioesterase-1
MRILIFGDSIAQGFFDTLHGGWVQILAQEFMAEAVADPQGEWHTVFNLGVSGCSSDRLDARISGEIEARRWNDEPLAVVIAIGINDTLLMRGKPLLTEQQFYSSVDHACKKAAIETDRILVTGISCVDEAQCQPTPWDSRISYTNERISQFEKTLARLCKNNDLPFVPLFKNMQEQQAGRQLFADGVHPNSEGHALMADLIRPAVARLIA